MGPYDNPSADKFGPPPGQERFEPPRPRRRLEWSALLITLFFLIARVALDSVHATGRAASLVLAGMAGVFVAEFIKAKRARDKREEANQPVTHRITPR